MPKSYEEACKIVAEKVQNNVQFVSAEFKALPSNEAIDNLAMNFSAEGVSMFVAFGNVEYLIASYKALMRIGVLIGLEMRRDESIDELIRSAAGSTGVKEQ